MHFRQPNAKSLLLHCKHVPETTCPDSMKHDSKGATNAEHITAQSETPRAFEAADWAAEVLDSSGIDDARVDAEVLLGFAMACDRAHLYAGFREKLDEAHWHRYQTLVQRRTKREPLAYIVGTKEFMSLEFEVNRDVMIPRPETELLAEFAIQFLRDTVRASTTMPHAVIDIGTGSGCVAVTIAKNVPEAVVYASDISGAALTVAERNAQRHGVAKRMQFRCGDLYDAFAEDELYGKVSFIVSNPPYISRAELDELQPEIRRFEPEFACFGGDDGLLFHRKLVDGGAPFLADSGMICLEVGYQQAERVREIVSSDGRYIVADTLIDAAGIDRVVVARVKR